MARKESLIRQLDLITEQLIEMEERERLYGEDSDYPPETVLFFKYQFRPGGFTYTYTAVKCRKEGGWYLTGPRSPKDIPWEDLVAWWEAGNLVELWQVSEYTPIYVPKEV